MQAVISLICDRREEAKHSGLAVNICGAPLLARTIETAVRSGVDHVLLLHPRSIPEAALTAGLNFSRRSQISIETLDMDHEFDPDSWPDWQRILPKLQDRFLLLPSNLLPSKAGFKELIAASDATGGSAQLAVTFNSANSAASILRPALCVKADLLAAAEKNASANAIFTNYMRGAEEISHSPALFVTEKNRGSVERELVRRSGKETDGYYSKANRWMVRPAVRWFSHTPFTPNFVTIAGVFVGLASGFAYANATGGPGKIWTYNVMGGALYFLCVLFDEVDGMLARITFRESAFGCWLETIADYASYIFLFAGLTIGLYRNGGTFWLGSGGALIFGAIMTFIVVSHLRQIATAPGRPHEFRAIYHRKLESKSGNVISLVTRYTEFIIRKPAYCYYVFIFSLLGWEKGLMLLTAIGANAAWILALYSRQLFRPSIIQSTKAGVITSS